MGPSTDEPALDIARITAALNRHGVNYVVLGGVAATAHGAAQPTLDVGATIQTGIRGGHDRGAGRTPDQISPALVAEARRRPLVMDFVS